MVFVIRSHKIEVTSSELSVIINSFNIKRWNAHIDMGNRNLKCETLSTYRNTLSPQVPEPRFFSWIIFMPEEGKTGSVESRYNL